MEIKRCPFCGRRATYGKGNRRKTDFKFIDGSIKKAGSWMWRPSIGCKGCEIRREFDSLEEAFEWWNRRKGEKS